jgi:hypothetical protein
MLLVAWVGGSWLGAAIAAEESLTCAQAYERAQSERTTGQLKAAIAHLRSCIAPSCAKFIREDCVRWMGEAASALPTVIFSIREDGIDVTDGEILCDDKPLTSTLDGQAIPVDPGLHDFAFNIPGLVPIERQVLIREGERDRLIKVQLSRPTIASPSPSQLSVATTTLPAEQNLRSGTHRLPYAFAGVGAVGITGFTVFALLGNRQQGDLERTCSPNCQSSQVESIKTKYLLADTCLGVSLISLGVATYMLVKSHGAGATSLNPATSVSFIPRSAGAGGVLQLFTSY